MGSAGQYRKWSRIWNLASLRGDFFKHDIRIRHLVEPFVAQVLLLLQLRENTFRSEFLKYDV